MLAAGWGLTVVVVVAVVGRKKTQMRRLETEKKTTIRVTIRTITLDSVLPEPNHRERKNLRLRCPISVITKRKAVFLRYCWFFFVFGARLVVVVVVSVVSLSPTGIKTKNKGDVSGMNKSSSSHNNNNMLLLFGYRGYRWRVYVGEKG